MPYNRLSTTKIAKAIGCHPNTVRFYEDIGFLSPVPRSPKGYRLYDEVHFDQMRLAWTAMRGRWAGHTIRRSAVALIRCVASRDYQAAVEAAHRHLSLVRLEREHAEAAVAFLELWVKDEVRSSETIALQTTQAARLLDITVDMMRNWERSGLITVPRNPANGYRQYSAAEIGRLRVIRLLRQAGYSPMAILRMLVQLDHSIACQWSAEDLRRALDEPRPDEDVYSAFDSWLTTLNEQELRAKELIAFVEEMNRKYGAVDLPT
jgi:DNA-binding transcriptional MerR regulator